MGECFIVEVFVGIGIVHFEAKLGGAGYSGMFWFRFCYGV